MTLSSIISLIQLLTSNKLLHLLRKKQILSPAGIGPRLPSRVKGIWHSKQIEANMSLYIKNETFGYPRITYNEIFLHYIAGLIPGIE